MIIERKVLNLMKSYYWSKTGMVNSNLRNWFWLSLVHIHCTIFLSYDFIRATTEGTDVQLPKVDLSSVHINMCRTTVMGKQLKAFEDKSYNVPTTVIPWYQPCTIVKRQKNGAQQFCNMQLYNYHISSYKYMLDISVHSKFYKPGDRGYNIFTTVVQLS